MKIVLAHNSYQQPGGEDVVFRQECELLARHGHQVVTYQRTNHEIDRLPSLDRLLLAKRIIWAEDSRRDLAQLLRNEKPDVVHVHNTFMMISPSIYQACREARVPIIQTLHNYRLLCPAANFFRDGQTCEQCVQHGLWCGIWHGCYRDSTAKTAGVALMLELHRFRRTWSESIDAYIALSEFSRKKFVDGGLPAAKIRVKPNFVYPDPGERKAPGNYALFVGRLSDEKGLWTLMDAWDRLGTSVSLRIIGDGPLRRLLEDHAVRQPGKQVTLLGQVDRDSTRNMMKDSAFLILPSVCYENFPMAIAEAFACGTPVLCSRLGGMQELVDDHRTGVHFTPGDPADLASKVNWALTHPAELAEMGHQARREYESRYHAETNYSHLISIYEHAVSAYA